ncbi:uncharacterized protein EKO05_0008673 [Ascochyta rabiei]|uniref:uncharacterized protein n=1 Tax=Didymella rabiei TaxID=5454 RepID=UPI0019020897|nr:uncharacterized protein EKO05_0008673 [Ascochyta rabiei]UPX18371.1 hypothetical protein EKO05_0008673 [Ascochyta rabiei]
MNTNRKSNMPAAGSTSSLSAIAKAITNFLFGEMPLPTSLSHYSAFFAGLPTSAMGASALYKYLNRNKCDRAKIQLAVYHIIHLFQHHPSYQALLQHPQELLMRMEPKVLCMLDKHLTKNEANEVTKELKRTYEAPKVEEYTRKRVRENECNVMLEQMGSDTIGARARARAQRGFFPELDLDWTKRTQEPKLIPVQPETKPSSPLETRGPRSDLYIQENALDDCNLLISDQNQLRVECGQYDEDMMDLDYSSYLTHPNTTMTPYPHDRRSSAPSPESSPPFTRFESSPTPAIKDDSYVPDDEFDAADGLDDLETPVTETSEGSAEAISQQHMKSSQQPRREGYGLSYDDTDLYSSSSSEEENVSAPTPPPDEYTPPDWVNQLLLKTNDLPSGGYAIDTPLHEPRPLSTRPPTVIAMVQGVNGRGTSLLPIPEGGSDSPHSMDDRIIPQECFDAVLPAQEENVPRFVPEIQVQTSTTQAEDMQLPFAHWSTTPEITYSDSDNSESKTGSESSASSVEAPLFSEPRIAASPAPTDKPALPVAQQTTNISSTTANKPTPTQETQRAAKESETETNPEPVAPQAHRSTVRPALSPGTTTRQQLPLEDQPSPPKKRKFPSTSQEREQEHTTQPSPKRRRTSPPRDITTPPPSPPPSPPTSSQKRNASPSQKRAPNLRHRRRCHSRDYSRSVPSPSPPSLPAPAAVTRTTSPPPAPRSAAIRTPGTGTRKLMRSKAFGGVYTE